MKGGGSALKRQENVALRQYLKEKKIYWWQVASQIGVAESTIVRWLRTPLSEEQEQAIRMAIAELEVTHNA